MFEICRKFNFEAAHRLLKSYSFKSQNIHGHSYSARIKLRSKELNEDGKVIDFIALDETLRNLFESLDHRLILCGKDPMAEVFKGVVDVLLVPYNPTMENIAKDLAYTIMSHFADLTPGFDSVNVELGIADSCGANYELGEAEFLAEVSDKNQKGE